MHPYRIYQIVPEAYPCSGIDPNFDEEKVIKAFDKHLKSITERNKRLISPALYQRLLQNPRKK